MSHTSRFVVFALSMAFLATLAAPAVDAQRHSPGGHHPPVRGGVVFVGGYFYDPFYGPYPWWPPASYPYPYVPMYDNRAELRVLVTPKEAAVYVDGFYAGTVDDFDGFFQRLPLPPGGHEIALYLEGYRTTRQRAYLQPDSTFKFEYRMEKLPAGETSEPPPLAPAVPPPPVDTFTVPRTPPRAWPPPVASWVSQPTMFGTLELRVLPAGAEVTIDGERWSSSDGEHFVVSVPPGRHRVEAFKRGYERFSTDLEVHEGETAPLNVSLMGDTR